MRARAGGLLDGNLVSVEEGENVPIAIRILESHYGPNLEEVPRSRRLLMGRATFSSIGYRRETKHWSSTVVRPLLMNNGR